MQEKTSSVFRKHKNEILAESGPLRIQKKYFWPLDQPGAWVGGLIIESRVRNVFCTTLHEVWSRKMSAPEKVYS